MAKSKTTAKRGRPPADNKLSVQIFTRLDESTHERLKAAGKQIERAPAWILRKAAEEWLERNGFPAAK